MNHRARLRSLSLGFVLLALIACSDDDDPTDSGPPDTTAPGITSVTALDATHINVRFNEAVARSSAENTGNYILIQSGPFPVAERDRTAGGMIVRAAVLLTDNRTVTLSSDPMTAVPYQLVVRRVEDTHGNAISDEGINQPFPGSAFADNTPPVIAYRNPAPNATGVPLGMPIQITFSEPVQYNTVESGFSLRKNGVSSVLTTLYSSDDTHYTVVHDVLELNTSYTVALVGVEDMSNNPTVNVASWTFHTTTSADVVAPTLVSSVPANNAVNVSVNTNLSLTFSEPINQLEFIPVLSPGIASSVTEAWSNGGKTVTYDPEQPLLVGTQYTLAIFPGGMRDLAGNENTTLVQAVFTTGPALETGSIAGTISGDPNSANATDPTGGVVIAATGYLFGGGDYTVKAVAAVQANNTYNLAHLPDETYFPLCVLDTFEDGFTDPLLGDAIGFYGIDYPSDTDPDSVLIAAGGSEAGVDFPLYDPTAVYGTIEYEGQHNPEAYIVYVGLFDTDGFDPGTSQPVVGTVTDGQNPFFIINSLEVGPIPNDDYYLGAFMDVNSNETYEPATDPAGLFPSGNQPLALSLANGTDAGRLTLHIYDPVPGLSTASVRWPTKPHNPWLKKLSAVVREAQLMQK